MQPGAVETGIRDVPAHPYNPGPIVPHKRVTREAVNLAPQLLHKPAGNKQSVNNNKPYRRSKIANIYPGASGERVKIIGCV